ncbi:hypothetical protein GJ744_011013 [Endocarpon pusillum]|uniref:ATP synthase mitochondrial F1 complex assembly factor 2 n=1 Tax=Endocarpon pusillum TaxID=364733 RepID=A0A8H7AGG6_9EURO|nr:hypothetical protein GJ744_011013 [Endocarpon pusillum]
MPANNAKAIVKSVFTPRRVTRARTPPPPVAHICRTLHNSSRQLATPLPVGVVGPAPNPPPPATPQYGERISRRRKQVEMLRQAKELRSSQDQKGRANPLKKRFWKGVDVKETPHGYQIFLDSRPVRTPHKTILTIPLSKPHLAHAIALEWDLLTSAQQALKTHNIPLTSLTSHADAILQQEAASTSASASSPPPTHTRDLVIQTVMRYLDTDTLLCWAPEPTSSSATQTAPPQHRTRTRTRHAPSSLREIQRQTAQPILAYLTTRVWPGADLHPVLDGTSIVPKKQPDRSTKMIRGWVAGLPAYELAALERATLATKSLLVATRLLVEWSEEFRPLQQLQQQEEEEEEEEHDGGEEEGEVGGATRSSRRFGIDEAAEACSTEVSWQTAMWGEVEDTHDVDREDLRRQLGSVVLLVGGNR